MSDSFNGYHVWLGIPPKEQPPNHYRLLGISIFETDQDVIDHAADRQMSHVRTFQSGRHGSLSQQILNELSTARLCLLNAEKKAAYDEQLRAKLSSVTSAVPVAKATPVAPSGVPRAAPVMSAGDSSVLGGKSGILSPGNSSVVSPGNSSVISPGNSSVFSTGNSSVVTPGSSGLMPPGKSGPISPSKSGTIVPGKAIVQGKAVVSSPGSSGVGSAGKSGIGAAGKSGVISPGKSGTVKPVPIQPVQPVEPEVEVLPLDMALAEEAPLAAKSIQIRGRRRSFRQGPNWQRPLFMGLLAAVLVTGLVLSYYFIKWLASPEFKEMFDKEFMHDPAAATAPADPAAHAAPPPTIPSNSPPAEPGPADPGQGDPGP